jgi:hypothetical protein
MRTLLLCALALLLSGTAVQAQQQPERRHRAYVELGGHAGFIGINYERVYPSGLSIRAGRGWDLYMEDCHEVQHIFLGTSLSCRDELTVKRSLLMLNRLVGSRHRLELGGGVSVNSVSGIYQDQDVPPTWQLSLAGALGYRYERRRSLFRLTATPSYGFGDVVPVYRGLYGSVGMSLGWVF